LVSKYPRRDGLSPSFREPCWKGISGISLVPDIVICQNKESKEAMTSSRAANDLCHMPSYR
jgi:hypothetical protein